MCQKEVDLHLSQSCQSKQPPEHQEMESFHSSSQCFGYLSMKNRAITKKERQGYNSGNSVNHEAFSGRQRARIIIEGLRRNQPQEIQQTKLYSTIQSVVGCSLHAASGTYYSFANCGTKVLSSAVQKLQWSRGTVAKCIFILLLFETVCSAKGHDNTFLGKGFPSKIRLNCQGPGKWLCGPNTIAVNVTNLIIDYQNMKTNYVCEFRAPNRTGPELCTFPMQVFNSCSVDEKDDFDAFKEGKKYIEVELEGKVAGSGSVRQQNYSLFIRNDTMEISPDNRSRFQLQPDGIRCSIKYKNMDMNPPKVSGTVMPSIDNGDGYKSKLIVGILMAAVGVIVMCLLGYGITRWRKWRRGRETLNLEEGTPAIGIRQ